MPSQPTLSLSLSLCNNSETRRGQLRKNWQRKGAKGRIRGDPWRNQYRLDRVSITPRKYNKDASPPPRPCARAGVGRCPKRRDNGRGPGHPVGLNPLSARCPSPSLPAGATRCGRGNARTESVRLSPSRRTVASLAAFLDRRPGNTVRASTNSRLRVCSPLLPSVDLSARTFCAWDGNERRPETELRESLQHVRYTEVEEEKERRRRIYIRRWWRAETSTTGTKDVARGGPP